MTIAVRPATSADIPAIHALVEGGYRGDRARQGWTHEADLLDGQRTDADALAAMIAHPAQTILLHHGSAGALLACVAVTLLADHRAYLGMLTVAPESQGEGTGRRMIAAAEDFARAHGAAMMELTVISQRTELIAWYGRRGYADTGERRPFPYGDTRFGLPRRDDLDFVVLARRLESSSSEASGHEAKA